MKKKLGRIDIANFPELHLSEIDIKVDTGAYTSTMHSHDFEEVTVDGEKCIRFKLLDPFHPKYNEKQFMFKNYTTKTVKSSNGVVQQRFAIQTTIEIYNETYPIQLTLSERSTMKYPILLGRTFLNKRFIVDTSKSNLSITPKDKK